MTPIAKQTLICKVEVANTFPMERSPNHAPIVGYIKSGIFSGGITSHTVSSRGIIRIYKCNVCRSLSATPE
jgi:hypothetical protein